MEKKEPIIDQNSNGESLSFNSEFIEESDETEQSIEEVSEYFPNLDLLNPDPNKKIITGEPPYLVSAMITDLDNKVIISNAIFADVYKSVEKEKEDIEDLLFCVKFYVAVRVDLDAVGYKNNYNNSVIERVDKIVVPQIGNYFAQYGIDYNNYRTCGLGQRYIGSQEKPFYLTFEQIIAFEGEKDMGIMIMYANNDEKDDHGYMDLKYPHLI